MGLFSNQHHSCSIFLSLVLFLIFEGVSGATFTFVNKCEFTVWPGILGSPELGSTGFELTEGSSRSFQAPTGWSGRFWGRAGCNFDSSSAVEPVPPVIVDLERWSAKEPVLHPQQLWPSLHSALAPKTTTITGCVTDLNRRCPSELRVDGGDACKSACDAFGKPEYCCSGSYNSPSACKPSMYSQVFKSACPKSYSYAYDDATSTFTCTGADYSITFCPSSSPSSKSSSDSSPKTTDGSGSESGSGSGPDSQIQAAALASTEWLANLATAGASIRTQPCEALQSAFLLVTTILSLLFF
ncbi:Thaumatin [Quillaja saponaria]|uniref:Thaumatin n=1 Tax=Quillaja saponaria TaxID=32244 RepID=A0AAD7P6W5_QUISA|nr:Thaumatin [Quillaja saponaria]